MPPTVKLTHRDLDNLDCGISLCVDDDTIRAVIVPEGHSVKTPAWADEKLEIAGWQLRKVRSGERISLYPNTVVELSSAP